jgi:hypothetical protein
MSARQHDPPEFRSLQQFGPFHGRAREKVCDEVDARDPPAAHQSPNPMHLRFGTWLWRLIELCQCTFQVTAHRHD